MKRWVPASIVIGLTISVIAVAVLVFYLDGMGTLSVRLVFLYVLDVAGFSVSAVGLPVAVVSLWYAKKSLDGADKQLRTLSQEAQRRSKEVVLFDDFPDPVFRSYLRERHWRLYGALKLERGEPACLGFTEDELLGIENIALDDLAVSSLEGIGVFQRLKTLSCNRTLLERLDVNGLEVLTDVEALNCSRLREVSCSGCKTLERFKLNGSNVVSLDCSRTRLSIGSIGCEGALERLTCRAVTAHVGSGPFSGRHLGSIDLDLFPCLEYLDCAENQISRICSSGPAELRVLDARENGLMCIDASACASLESVRCSLGVGVDEIGFCAEVRRNAPKGLFISIE